MKSEHHIDPTSAIHHGELPRHAATTANCHSHSPASNCVRHSQYGNLPYETKTVIVSYLPRDACLAFADVCRESLLVTASCRELWRDATNTAETGNSLSFGSPTTGIVHPSHHCWPRRLCSALGSHRWGGLAEGDRQSLRGMRLAAARLQFDPKQYLLLDIHDAIFTLPPLRRVNFSGASILDTHLECISHYPLEMLALCDCTSITRAGFRHLERLGEHLEELNLAGCATLDKDSVLSIATFKNLRVLNLSMCRRIQDLTLAIVGRRLLKLEVLSLANCYNISNSGVAYLCQLPLKWLSLQECFKITDSVAERLPVSLQHLVLRCCLKLTDDFITRASERLVSLVVLDLTGCYRIGAASLMQKMGTQLHELRLAWCFNVADLAIRELGHSASFRVLDLRGCNQLSDVGVETIVSRLPHLKHLDLEECRNITDAAVKRITEQLLHLEVLSVKGCSQLTDTSIEHLRKLATTQKTLKIVNVGGCLCLSPLALAMAFPCASGVRLAELPVPLPPPPQDVPPPPLPNLTTQQPQPD